MTEISNQAFVDPAAKIGQNVRIGPFCMIGPDVEIGDGCNLMNQVTIQGVTRIGKGNVFYPNAVVGVAPQDLKYDGAPTETIIGDQNVFREFCTVHRGTELGGGKTVIGNQNFCMVGAHIAHDCILENRILLGNQTQLAGHVHIEEGAVISALIGLHHFVRGRRYSYIGGMTPVRRDVPPFMKFSGDPNEVRGVNEEGLRRNGFSPESIEAIKDAYRILFRKNTSLSAGLEELAAQKTSDEHVLYLCDFIRKSCESRFGRYQENFRRDERKNRRSRPPLEVRPKEQES